MVDQNFIRLSNMNNLALDFWPIMPITIQHQTSLGKNYNLGYRGFINRIILVWDHVIKGNSLSKYNTGSFTKAREGGFYMKVLLCFLFPIFFPVAKMPLYTQAHKGKIK